MQLHDEECAALLARMRKDWTAGLFPAPELSLVRAKPPKQQPTETQKRAAWHGAGQGPKRAHNALDYAVWCADLAGFCATPRAYTEIAARYGISEGGAAKRLQVARREGHWPPAGMTARWVAEGSTRRLVVRAR